MAICLHSMPAMKAPTIATGTSTIAVPRSGCFKISAAGTIVKSSDLHQIRQRQPVGAYFAEKASQHNDYNQLHQL